jgi:pyruvate dehydrogenase E2 component (dihydrolipoamide acetyltransferase)
MEQEIVVPDIGDYKDVEIIEIGIKTGDNLKKDDTLITLETDKATMDIPAPSDLTINKLHVKLGDKVSRGSLIATALVSTASEQNVKANQAGKSSGDSHNTENLQNFGKFGNYQQNNQPTQSSRTFSGRADGSRTSASSSGTTAGGMRGFSNASPGVRKFARELGVDLSGVTGTHKNGRITEHDVKHYVQQALNNQANSAHQVAQPAPAANPFANIDFSKWGEVTEQPLPRIKKKSGKHLHTSWNMIPHVTHFDTADITELEKYRKKLQQDNKAKNIKLTPLTFFIKAIVNSLKEYPNFNSSLSADNNSLVLKNYYNIGIAVDTEAGLVVPVVKNADQKTILQLAADLTAISQKARDNKLTGDDLQGGCFTISSLGGIGGASFTPIINAPEVGILGISRSKLTPTYIDGELQPRLILPITLSYDHRVIDGAEAARFSKFFVQQLEDIKNFYE